MPSLPGNERLIVDGYNVIHVCGLARGAGPGSMARARNLLVGFVRRHLPNDLTARTAIVFDSRQTGEADAVSLEDGPRVEFATAWNSADERIIELIRRNSAPKQLLVVSSDHEIQQAARSRRAAHVDSDRWLEELTRQNRSAGHRPLQANEPPIDVALWMKELGITGDDAGLWPTADEVSGDSASNPFPPGYADDLLRDEDLRAPDDPGSPGMR